MILYEIEGERIDRDSFPPVHETTWAATRAGAEAYCAAQRWKTNPQITKVRVPRTRDEMVDFLNHYAGA